MKKYMVVKTEILEKILRCFANQEEFETFAGEFGGMIEEVVFAGQVANRNIEDKELVNLMTVKQIFLLGLFCQQNLDVIHDLVSIIEYTEITEEQKKGLSKEFPKKDLDRDEG